MRSLLLLAAAPAFVFASFTSVAQTGNWTSRSALPVSGRVGAYSFVINGTAYAGGGDTDPISLNDLWAYNASTNTWTAKASLPGPGRGAASCFVIGSKAYVTCGESNGGTGGSVDLNDAWVYDAPTNTWSALPPLPGNARVGAFAFAVGGKGYVGGGALLDQQPVQLTDCWSFDPATNQWTAAPAPPMQSLTLSAGFSLLGYGYVAGGVDFSSFVSINADRQVWRFDANTQQWTRMSDMPMPRAYAACFIGGDNAYAAEGISGFGSSGNPTAAHEVMRYDPIADDWTAFQPVSGSNGRLAPFGFSVGTSIYVGGGLDNDSGDVLADFWELANVVTDAPADLPATAFSLAPNPATTSAWLTGAPAGPAQLLDGLGRTVRTLRVAPGLAPTRLDLSGLPAGVYSLRCGTQARRLVVE